METPILEIRLFGPINVTLRGAPLPRLRSRTVYWLLALLALRLGREVSRAWLATTLWPDSEASLAYYNLRRCLTNLRQALGTASELLRSPTPQTLCLAPEGVWVDVAAFDAAIAQGAPEFLERAVALHAGLLLEGCPEEWVLVERTTRAQNYIAALETLAAHETVQLRPANAVRLLRVLVAADPAREESQCALMQALADSGDFTAITQVYRDLCTRLDREFQAIPSPETEALYHRLLQQAMLPFPRPETPPDPTQSPRRLPVPLTRLIGREAQVKEILTHLASSRLVTLTGAGGIGKTRLAIEVAEQAASHTPDGVFFVDLAPLAEGSLMVHAVAQTLQLQETPGQSLQDLLRTHLRARHLLLVLDNCEHLLATSAALTADLVDSCPHLRILATSRQALGITGEVSYRVPSLSAPPARFTTEGEQDRLLTLVDYGSVRLFVERARAVDSSFAVNKHNAGAIAEICRRLDGIPLALEMAAAWVKTLSAVQIAERLEASFAMLSRGSRTALPRQQTLQATLDWSWDLLSVSEQVLLARLSVFVAGWTLEAAERVGGSGEETLGSLAGLVDKSMVFAEEQYGLARYRVLEPVRLYAWDRMVASGESDWVRMRHRDYFLALAEETEPKLAGSELGEWLQRLEAEHKNLRTALDWSLSQADSGEALRLCGALSRFWWTRGYLAEGREWCDRALDKARGRERSWEQAKALNGAGGLAYHQGAYTSAQAYFEESLAIHREIGDRSGIALPLNNLGNVAWNQGDYTSARAYHEESLAIRREIGDRSGIASSLNNLGLVADAQSDYVSARVYHGESLAIRREIGDRYGIAASLNNLGNVVYAQGDYASARIYYEESLTQEREVGNFHGIASSLGNLGNVVSAQGDYLSARTYYEESLAIRREIGDRRGIAYSLGNLANIAYSQIDYLSAQTYHEESLAILREIGDRFGIAHSLNNLGNVGYAQGDYGSARTYHEESLAIRREIGDRNGIAHSLNNLGNVAYVQGNYVATWAYYEESLSIRREIGDRLGIAESLLSLAGLAVNTGKPEQAAILWGASEALRDQTGSSLQPNQREAFDCAVAELRQALGEEAFSISWAKGRSLTWEQAVVCALKRPVSREPVAAADKL